jgi:hypothetical protein
MRLWSGLRRKGLPTWLSNPRRWPLLRVAHADSPQRTCEQFVRRADSPAPRCGWSEITTRVSSSSPCLCDPRGQSVGNPRTVRLVRDGASDTKKGGQWRKKYYKSAMKCSFRGHPCLPEYANCKLSIKKLNTDEWWRRRAIKREYEIEPETDELQLLSDDLLSEIELTKINSGEMA